MDFAIIAIVAILIIVIIILVSYNISIHKKIQTFNNMNQRITNLNVVQDFMNAIGEDTPVETKIRKINDILIEKYDIKYSTIVVFDGSEYVVKASNVDEKHYDALKSLHEVSMFKDSISTATPKYVTVNHESERLPYQKMEFGRAKSAIFFPLYIDNVYIGYWIIESGIPHDFDNVDTSILEIVKDNIITILKTVVHQQTLEAIVRKDLYSGLYSEEYLYGEGKKKIDQYTISTICMFKITNLSEINEKISRKLGNEVIIKVAEQIKQNISENYIFIRYMGPKFVIAFSGVEKDSVAEFLNDVKQRIENMEISLETDIEIIDLEEDTKKSKNKKEKPQIAIPKLNFVIASYYKGTGLEEVLKKLETYLDNASEDENEINEI